MTLILALACSGGVVVASDSQATYSTSGQPTKLSMKKIFQLGGVVSLGVLREMLVYSKIYVWR